MYVSGQNFELETDQKPLERIHSRTRKPCAQIERWVLCLQGFNFTVVVYRPGKTNISVALSRLNSVKTCDSGQEYGFVITVVENNMPVAVSPRETEEVSYNDEEFSVSREELHTVWALGKLYTPLVRFYQGRIMDLWRIGL